MNIDVIIMFIFGPMMRPVYLLEQGKHAVAITI